MLSVGSTVAGAPVDLTDIEYRMLAELSANAGRIMTHEQLLRRVWGQDATGGSGPVRAIVKRLRRKLGDDAADPTYIFNKRRVGYWMEQGEGREREGAVTELKAADRATAPLLAFLRPVTPQCSGSGLGRLTAPPAKYLPLG